MLNSRYLCRRSIVSLTKILLFLFTCITLILLLGPLYKVPPTLEILLKIEENDAVRHGTPRPAGPLVPPAQQFEAVIRVRKDKDKEIDAVPETSPDLAYDPNAPGEMGRPFVTPANLSEAEQKLVSEGWEKNAFNQYASDRISIRRRLPDVRDPWCKVEGRFSQDLPATSIIIIFYNEALSVLLRTFHSAVDRAPEHLITEILIWFTVHRYDSPAELHEPLETYVANYPKVRIIRAKERVGLIQARLMGAAAAKGPVLTFLDSHVEATPGWLEPLLHHIHQDPTTVVSPVSDIIEAETFAYTLTPTGDKLYVGGFDWELLFNWHKIPERERKRHAHPAEPVASPTMLGGQFSISKAYFEKLGMYDPGFQIWGSEHLELSFKTWMCGGGLFIIPCSRVAHMFRKIPYKLSTDVDVVRINNVRLAKVWLDDYAEYYFDRIGNNVGDYGDISDRVRLRQSLDCKSFRWYLNEVYPELYNPDDDLVHGVIRNQGLGGNLCLDAKETNVPLHLQTCNGRGGNQFWSYSRHGQVRRDDLCVDYSDGTEPVIRPCNGSTGSQNWVYDDETGLVRHGQSRKCLDVRADSNQLVVEACDEIKDTQRWKFGS